MTKLEFLNDTIRYYNEDTNRRCVDHNNCYYSPNSCGKQDISEGCAIGRFLDADTKKLFDRVQGDSFCGIKGILDSKKSRIKLLPIWMQGFDPDFLLAVQALHDTDAYWDKDGLTEFGLQRVNNIKKEYINETN